VTTERDIREVRLGELELLGRGLSDVAEANRKMCLPLVDIIKGLGITGNDKADLKALRGKIERSIDKLDSKAVERWAEKILMQTYAIARTAAVPPGIEGEVFDGEPESLLDVME